MDESLFKTRVPDAAQALTKPEFGVLMAMAALRQAMTPTARALAGQPAGGGVPRTPGRVALFSDLAGPSRGTATSFWQDADEAPATDARATDAPTADADSRAGACVAGDAVNRDVSGNVQPMGPWTCDRDDEAGNAQRGRE